MSKAIEFWKLQADTLQSMFLNQDALFLDSRERAEIDCHFPSTQSKRILELALPAWQIYARSC